MEDFMKVSPLHVGDEKLTPVIWEMDGRRRPDMFTDKMLNRYRAMGYTLREHQETGFTFVYKEKFDTGVDDRGIRTDTPFYPHTTECVRKACGFDPQPCACGGEELLAAKRAG